LDAQKKVVNLSGNIATQQKLNLWLTENGRAVDAPAIAEAEQNQSGLTTFHVVESAYKKRAHIAPV